MRITEPSSHLYPHNQNSENSIPHTLYFTHVIQGQNGRRSHDVFDIDLDLEFVLHVLGPNFLFREGKHVMSLRTGLWWKR